MSVTPRLNRLFAADGKCFDVAIDHGLFNEPLFLQGIEDMRQAITTIVEADPDAVQLSVGQAKILQSIPGKQKPALVLRTDVANVYGPTLPDHVFSQLIDRPVEQALALDAACVVVNIFLIPQQPQLYHQCIQNVISLKIDCERFGMPLMVEPLVMRPNDKGGAYMVDGDAEKIVPLVRQAVELGADIIKADPTTDIADYRRVIEAAGGHPVLPRGGSKGAEELILQRTYDLMSSGAAGIVYGRNVIQHEQPAAMTRALMSVIHSGASVADALALLGRGTREKREVASVG